MALVHAQSCDCMKSEWTCLPFPPTQANVETGHTLDRAQTTQYHRRWRNLGESSKRADVVIVDSDAFNGDATKNPFHFKHQNVNFLALNLDGHLKPEVYLSPRLRQQQIRQVFRKLVCGNGKVILRRGKPDRQEWILARISPVRVRPDAIPVRRRALSPR